MVRNYIEPSEVRLVERIVIANKEISIKNNTNVEIICMRCNTTKGARTKTEFINYCKTVYNKFGGI